ncbi:alpha/beta fold hydrolase [Dyadobacter sp. CY356]|uniref:alpha/beta hydrolase n=1 Tax=Dyadobacter sp. CY356 TaxID=2906442 RepID=UPI001F2971AA|nr:alpha/beta hydrolase [Dyadobacter sp. CY356]MCF0056327.1 alpha/beta hydrolase [Dyadobacter sp. CY356]
MNTEIHNETDPYSDEELIKKWPGFENKFATVNGVTLHYVEGGSGEPLICLPGWPQTWYSFHTIAPELAKNYKVIVVDIRGMGTSEKPASGYDKKTMAKDIHELTIQLGLEKVHLLGHDIGGMVAMSFAFNYPEAVAKLILMDGSHPSEGMLQMPLIPPMGSFKDKMDGQSNYAWWMSFNQVKGLPEKLLEDRFQYLLDWLFAYVMIDETKMSVFDRAVYASAYNQPESIRASNAWYQSFAQDIEDAKNYQQLAMPVLGIGSNVGYNFMCYGLPFVTKDCNVIDLQESGHYMNEEEPEKVLEAVLNFLG